MQFEAVRVGTHRVGSCRTGLTGPVSRSVEQASVEACSRRCFWASHHRFSALEPVLAELDEARRALAPSGLELSVVLLAPPQHADDAHAASLALAGQLGLDLRILPTSTDDFGRALLDGLRAAVGDSADLVVSLDADGQHDPRQIPTLIRSHLARSTGLTVGSRWIPPGVRHREPAWLVPRSVAPATHP